MSDWVTCPACHLKHTARPDGVCPRCKTSLAPASEDPGATELIKVPEALGGGPPAAPVEEPPAPPPPAAPPPAAAPPAAAPPRRSPGVPQPPAPRPPVAPPPTAAPRPASPAPPPMVPAPQPAARAAVPGPAAGGGLPSLVYPNEPMLFGMAVAFSLLVWLGLLVGTFGVALLFVPFVFVLYLFAQSGLIAYIKGTAVKITPQQFPDLHGRLVACCQKLGMQRVPDCYLMNGQGGFNAFATRFLGRNFVVLFSDVVDALEQRPGAVNFYIGHELAHIQRGHLKWGPVLMPAALLPLIGAAYHRACESTCDRYGAACCADAQEAVAGICALAAGEKRWKDMSVDEYVAQAQESGGFWMSFHELVADYPWLVKRAARVIAFRSGRDLQLPSRNPLAYLFAIFVPRTLGSGAGGLMSLLVVVMIILVIAAIAIPSLLRARISTNESAAVGDIREVIAAEVTYAGQHGRFASLECLAGQVGCAGTPAMPPVLGSVISASDMRHGYRFTLALDEAGGTEFAYTAVPVTPGRTGFRSFCGDSTGAMYYVRGRTDLLYRGGTRCSPELLPLGS